MTYQFTISGHAGQGYPQNNPEQAERSFRREHAAVEAAVNAAIAVLRTFGLEANIVNAYAMKGAVSPSISVGVSAYASEPAPTG